jgi:hypothetical protein
MSHRVLDTAFDYMPREFFASHLKKIQAEARQNPVYPNRKLPERNNKSNDTFFPAILTATRGIFNAVSPWFFRDHEIIGDDELELFVENLDTLEYCTHLQIALLTKRKRSVELITKALQKCSRSLRCLSIKRCTFRVSEALLKEGSLIHNSLLMKNTSSSSSASSVTYIALPHLEDFSFQNENIGSNDYFNRYYNLLDSALYQEVLVSETLAKSSVGISRKTTALNCIAQMNQSWMPRAHQEKIFHNRALVLAAKKKAITTGELPDKKAIWDFDSDNDEEEVQNDGDSNQQQQQQQNGGGGWGAPVIVVPPSLDDTTFINALPPTEKGFIYVTKLLHTCAQQISESKAVSNSSPKKYHALAQCTFALLTSYPTDRDDDAEANTQQLFLDHVNMNNIYNTLSDCMTFVITEFGSSGHDLRGLRQDLSNIMELCCSIWTNLVQKGTSRIVGGRKWLPFHFAFARDTLFIDHGHILQSLSDFIKQQLIPEYEHFLKIELASSGKSVGAPTLKLLFPEYYESYYGIYNNNNNTNDSPFRAAHGDKNASAQIYLVGRLTERCLQLFLAWLCTDVIHLENDPGWDPSAKNRDEGLTVEQIDERDAEFAEHTTNITRIPTTVDDIKRNRESSIERFRRLQHQFFGGADSVDSHKNSENDHTMLPLSVLTHLLKLFAALPRTSCWAMFVMRSVIQPGLSASGRLWNFQRDLILAQSYPASSDDSTKLVNQKTASDNFLTAVTISIRNTDPLISNEFYYGYFNGGWGGVTRFRDRHAQRNPEEENLRDWWRRTCCSGFLLYKYAKDTPENQHAFKLFKANPDWHWNICKRLQQFNILESSVKCLENLVYFFHHAGEDEVYDVTSIIECLVVGVIDNILCSEALRAEVVRVLKLHDQLPADYNQDDLVATSSSISSGWKSLNWIDDIPFDALHDYKNETVRNGPFLKQLHSTFPDGELARLFEQLDAITSRRCARVLSQDARFLWDISRPVQEVDRYYELQKQGREQIGGWRERGGTETNAGRRGRWQDAKDVKFDASIADKTSSSNPWAVAGAAAVAAVTTTTTTTFGGFGSTSSSSEAKTNSVWGNTSGSPWSAPTTSATTTGEEEKLPTKLNLPSFADVEKETAAVVKKPFWSSAPAEPNAPKDSFVSNNNSNTVPSWTEVKSFGDVGSNETGMMRPRQERNAELRSRVGNPPFFPSQGNNNNNTNNSTDAASESKAAEEEKPKPAVFSFSAWSAPTTTTNEAKNVNDDDAGASETKKEEEKPASDNDNNNKPKSFWGGGGGWGNTKSF